MNITHSINGHPNTGRQAEIILEREKKKPRKKPESKIPGLCFESHLVMRTLLRIAALGFKKSKISTLIFDSLGNFEE